MLLHYQSIHCQTGAVSEALLFMTIVRSQHCPCSDWDSAASI